MQPIAIAEWTALPFVLSSWQAMQVEGSAFGSSGTGCLAAEAVPTSERPTNKQLRDHLLADLLKFDLDLAKATAPTTSVTCYARIQPSPRSCNFFQHGV